MKNILLPIDLYGDPKGALQKALAFLQGIEGHLTVLLLKTYMVPAFLSNQVIETHDQFHNQAQEILQKELKEALELSIDGKITFETILQMGKPANVISRLVKERNIYCVVVGPEETMGGFRNIHCPIVVLPTSAT